MTVKEAESSRQLVCCGKPLPGIEIKIVNEQSLPVLDGHTGRIFVRGDNIMRGYYADEAATIGVLYADGFLDTGDLGCMVNGQLVISGRAKDMILQRGRNIWPQDVEAVAMGAAQLRMGTVAAVGIDDGAYETLIILVELGSDDAQKRLSVSSIIQSAVSRSLGVAGMVVFVSPRWLPFTSSGKLARQQARRKLIDERLNHDDFAKKPV